MKHIFRQVCISCSIQGAAQAELGGAQCMKPCAVVLSHLLRGAVGFLTDREFILNSKYKQ